MECGMVGWSASRLAGWLVAWLPLREPTNTDPLFFSLSLSSSCVYHSLCVYTHNSCLENAGRSGETKVVSAKKKFFNARSQVTVEGGRMGHEILLFFLPFSVTFRFLWSRERNFNCAVVCLVMRVRAPFFHLVSTGNCWCRGRGGGETSSSFWPLCTLPSRASSYGRRNENSPSPPFVPHLFCVDSTLLGLSPTVVSRAGGFVSLSVHTGRKWTSGSFLATMYSRSIRGSYICVYTYASSLIRTKPAFEVWRYTRCVLLNRNRR